LKPVRRSGQRSAAWGGHDAGTEHQQILKVAAVQGQIDNGLRLEGSTDDGTGCIQQRRGRGHFHGLGDLARHQLSVDASILADSHGNILPLEGLKAALLPDKYDWRPYSMNVGDFYIELSTPPMEYRSQEERRLAAEKARAKRRKKQGQESDATTTEEAPRNWESESGGHKAIVSIVVMPKTKEGFWSGMGRAASAGLTPANLKFKTDFYRMRLMCGEKEIAPIHPGKIPAAFALKTYGVNFTDSAAFGDYTYPPDAISPNCGQQRLEIFPSKNSIEPVVKIFDPGTVQRVWTDFEAFRTASAAAPVLAPAIMDPAGKVSDKH